jgi:biopolymer transport protein TolQ
MVNTSLLQFFTHADPVVKTVMCILLIASIISWTLIIHHARYLFAMQSAYRQFQKLFWGGIDLTTLYSNINASKQSALQGLASIFHNGYQEFTRLRQHGLRANDILHGVERAMLIASNEQRDQLERNLGILATIGSVSPYVGLFGTVWGIMMSFQALGSAQQVTIAMVAPGISEALIATAMGLFAAIPAVIAYNRFVAKVDGLSNKNDIFQQELMNILARQAHLTAN